MPKNPKAKHLWESKHPYYCSDDNYFSNECHIKFNSWAEFLNAEGDSDFDMNLIFRWDWAEFDDNDEPSFNGDVNYRNGTLDLFYIGQRKGLFRSVEVAVCRADEPSIKKFLRPRMRHLLRLWAPLYEEVERVRV